MQIDMQTTTTSMEPVLVPIQKFGIA
jgi:hypothetical protein